MILAHPCCWHLCPYWATGQVVMPGPAVLSATCIMYLCAGHQRAWGVALGATGLGPDITWASFSYGRAPIVGSSVP